MDIKENSNTYDSLKYLWKFYRYVCGNPPEEFNLFYVIYFIFINFIVSIYYPLSMIIDLCVGRDLETVLDNFSLLLTIAFSTGKLFNFIIKRKQLCSIKPLFDMLDKRVTFDNDRKILKSKIKFAQNIFWFLFALYCETCVSGAISTYLNNHISLKKIMYPAYFPFDWSKSKLKWHVVFFYQFIAIITIAIQNACNDGCTALHLIMLTTHFRLLKQRVQRIGYDLKISTEDNYKELINCIEDYKTILEIHRVFAPIISFPMFLQYFLSGGVLTAAGLYILFAERNIYRDVYFVLYGVCILNEILAICYCANKLETESEGLTTAIYSCNWMDQNHKFRKVLISFMQRTQIYMNIRAANWLNVNLKGFLSMLRVAYSSFAVIRKMKVK